MAQSTARGPDAGPGVVRGSSLWALPYGVAVGPMMASYASLIPAIDFANGSGDRNCSAPSANVSRATAEPLSPSSYSLLCLNGIGSGVVDSAWETNLTNYTTYQNGTTPIHGCPPLPNQTGCGFYASNRYTANVSEWEDGAPVNSSTLWEPGENGYAPTDVVFYVQVSFNDSTVPGGVYSLTVDLSNATPAPVTFFVRTPTGGEPANVTVVFDLTAAWLTWVPSGPHGSTLVTKVVPEIPKTRVGSVAPPCSLCAVVFAETGLPTGTRWDVQVTGGSTVRSTSDTTSERLRNDTYSYTVGSANTSWAATKGEFTVQGGVLYVGVAFRLVTYLVSFTESGLPAGVNWSVTLHGVAHAGTGPTLSGAEPNGSYAFRVSALSGYSVNRSSGDVEVNGEGVLVPVRFTSTSPPAPVPGLPPEEAYALVATAGAIGAVGLLAAALYLRRRKLPPPTGAPDRGPPLPPSPPR